MSDWRKMTEEEIVIAEEIAALPRFRELNVKYHGCFIRDGKVIGCLENAKGCHGGGIVPDLGDTKTRGIVANAIIHYEDLPDTLFVWAVKNSHIMPASYSC